jgi:hypothetical protein
VGHGPQARARSSMTVVRLRIESLRITMGIHESASVFIREYSDFKAISGLRIAVEPKLALLFRTFEQTPGAIALQG